MPELPEMETYRKLLNEQIAGAVITGTEVTRDKSINVSPDEFQQMLVGRTIWYVERRGKHLIFHLDNGKRLELHLMLGGSMFFGSEEEKPDRTIQVTIRFEHGNLYFIGLRLGHLHLLSVKELEGALAKLGPDPFDKRLNAAKFADLFAKKRGTLKASLVDQQVLSGIGNCYADEIVYAASIRPDAKIPTLESGDWERLHTSMHSVLKEAIARGGYMDQPFTAADTLTGGYDELCQVYDRAGESCRRCGSTIEQIEVASRKAFVCPSCQKE
ncbi:bifunctional DNA-formamidopyrimidine glycosylase/DNA-(apurinic or apyrimidinic site) lyase [Paenibacillus protaetiae]|uniref:Formamidopyrimidine-DNA glycosylase n=1 Tax=Paenibacillus protaetiae TaxID=2509456 RepID=A0A4P6ESW2_9BACL|nr:bifunctional DNA-formamidopyrimidine glycosylase/DNA-(apurinic or apyrimidinic site) lyase [Paenibacillus protaetiae]QAY66042.1 bifunctional DNA-formamidopyrimidine glycosylase/DNA-(apurinic or apyrimidinic site) lyase [Paenibacillus protaetiae]